jgi:TonB family protein
MDTIDLPLILTWTKTMIERTARAIFVLCLAAQAAMASAADFEAALKKQYEQQVVALRHPLVSGKQVFDSDGRLLGSDTDGPWENYGVIRITQLDFKPDQITLSGSRITFKFDEAARRNLMSVQRGEDVVIEIHLAKPLDTPEAASAMLAKVIAPPEDAGANSVAESAKGQQKPGPYTQRISSWNGEQVFPLGHGVVAPRPVFTPEPEFSEKARRAGVGGTVVLNVIVDRAGKVAKVSVDRSVGMGLDEQAVETVKTWRFQPALREGEPVAVEMSIQVSFNLYKREPR